METGTDDLAGPLAKRGKTAPQSSNSNYLSSSASSSSGIFPLGASTHQPPTSTSSSSEFIREEKYRVDHDEEYVCVIRPSEETLMQPKGSQMFSSLLFTVSNITNNLEASVAELPKIIYPPPPLVISPTNLSKSIEQSYHVQAINSLQVQESEYRSASIPVWHNSLEIEGPSNRSSLDDLPI